MWWLLSYCLSFETFLYLGILGLGSISRAPARKFIKTSQDFKVWTKRRNGWLGPWQARVRTSFPGWSLFLKLDYKGSEEECWGRSFWNASRFSPFLTLLSPFRLPRTHLRKFQPRKASTERRKIGKKPIAAGMVFIDLNFPVSHLTFQRLPLFPHFCYHPLEWF